LPVELEIRSNPNRQKKINEQINFTIANNRDEKSIEEPKLKQREKKFRNNEMGKSN